MNEALPWIGGTLTALATLLGAYAAVKARQVDARTATRRETQQALDAQNLLLNRYQERIVALEAKVETVERQARDAIAAKAEMHLAHRDCLNRLSHAEARIAELGG